MKIIKTIINFIFNPLLAPFETGKENKKHYKVLIALIALILTVGIMILFK